ncbi:MAG: flagellar motor protein MotB [Pseudomonadota bacterium]
MSDQPAPIIIKRKKVIVGGHHGGAWKVAYADFVTAMMAFFLLMWLLGATTEKQRKGIADYFNPTIPVNKVSGGGAGAFGGDSVFTENTLAQNGTGAGLISQASETDDTAKQDASSRNGETGGEKDDVPDPMEQLEKMLSGNAGESMVSDLLQRHVITRLTDEGLIVEVFDTPDAPLFTGDSEPTPELQRLSGAIAEVFRLASNKVAVQGHTATVPLAARVNPVWARSAARANQARQLLQDAGLSSDRIQRVTGFADREPVVADPLSERNNRLEIILLRGTL